MSKYNYILRREKTELFYPRAELNYSWLELFYPESQDRVVIFRA
jgi:hypothetical protein